MTRALCHLAGLGLALALAGCSATTGDEVQPPRPQVEEPERSPEVADEVRLLSDRARAAVARATSGVRADLSAVRAAEDSLTKAAAGLRERLTAMRELAIDEGVDAAEAQVEAFLERLVRLEERSQTIQAAIDDVILRVDSFEDWADDVVRQARTDDSDTDYHRQQLLDVEVEAEELTRNIVLGPRTRASNRLSSEIAILGTDVEQAYVELTTEVARRQRTALAAQQSRDAAELANAAPELPPPPPPAVGSGEVAELTTSEGTLVLELFEEVAPRHVENFRKLVGEGFYDGLTFHRVVPGFVAQAGCPLGTGAGGPGYQLDAELNDRTHRRGTLSMARFAHPDSAGSQFFLCLADLPDLDGKYTVFGRMLRGEDTLAAIEALGTESGRPTETIEIRRIVVRERRPDELGGLADASPGG